MRSLFLVTIVLLFLCACQTQQVNVTHMASAESSIPGDVKNIAVFAYEYDVNALDPRFGFLKEDIPAAVSSAITQYGTYGVIERGRLKQIMQERMVSAGAIMNQKKAMEIAKVAACQALVMGKVTLVSHKDRNVPRTIELPSNDPDVPPQTREFPYLVRKVTLSVTSEMLHVKTGQKIITETFTETYDSEKDPDLQPGMFQRKDAAYYESLPGKVPSVEDILQKLAKKCANQFINKISAHPVEYNISLMEGSTPEIKEGAAWVKQGQYDRAIGEYQKVTNHKTDSAAAWYNMGVCYEALKRYTEALNAYERSNQIKSSSKAKEGIGRVSKYGR